MYIDKHHTTYHAKYHGISRIHNVAIMKNKVENIYGDDFFKKKFKFSRSEMQHGNRKVERAFPVECKESAFESQKCNENVR